MADDAKEERKWKVMRDERRIEEALPVEWEEEVRVVGEEAASPFLVDDRMAKISCIIKCKNQI